MRGATAIHTSPKRERGGAWLTLASSSLTLRVSVGLICFILLTPISAQQPGDEKAVSPEVCIGFTQVALEAGNLKQLAGVTAGERGVVFRKCVGPILQCQSSLAKLNTLLSEQPQLQFTNPFNRMLNLIDQQVFDVLEISKGKDQTMVRVRTGPKNRPREESLLLHQEEGLWRIDLPSEIAKSLQRLSVPGHADKQIKALNQLNELFKTLASEVEKKRFSTKEQLLLRFMGMIEEAKIKETLGLP